MALLDIHCDFLFKCTSFWHLSHHHSFALSNVPEILPSHDLRPCPIVVLGNISHGVRYNSQHVLLRLCPGMGSLGSLLCLGNVDCGCYCFHFDLFRSAFHIVGQVLENARS